MAELWIGRITIQPEYRHLVEGLGIALGPYKGWDFSPCLTDGEGLKKLERVDSQHKGQRRLFWSFEPFHPERVDVSTLMTIG